MSGDLSIKIRIAEREYPIKAPGAEEERLRLAGKIVNERIKNFRDKFKITDIQDLMAMVAFDLVVEHLKQSENSRNQESEYITKVDDLDKLINAVLHEGSL